MKLKRLFLGAVFALILMPINNTFADAQDFYFEDFTADYYLTKLEDGTSNLHVKEVLTAVFLEMNQNHGITRTIPYTNQGGENRTGALPLRGDRLLRLRDPLLPDFFDPASRTVRTRGPLRAAALASDLPL